MAECIQCGSGEEEEGGEQEQGFGVGTGCWKSVRHWVVGWGDSFCLCSGDGAWVDCGRVVYRQLSGVVVPAGGGWW